MTPDNLDIVKKDIWYISKTVTEIQKIINEFPNNFMRKWEIDLHIETILNRIWQEIQDRKDSIDKLTTKVDTNDTRVNKRVDFVVKWLWGVISWVLVSILVAVILVNIK